MSIVFDNQSEDANSFNAGDKSQNEVNSNEDVGLLRMKYKQTNNRVYHDFYKTKMCSLNNLTICKKGKNCPFAHSDDELREKPNLYKTKLCDAFLQGSCPNEEDCHFAHGEQELRSTPDLFKTAICNLWTQNKCDQGSQCRFAHGYDDLRPAPSHHKFKSSNGNSGPAKSHKKKQKFNNTNNNGGQNFYYDQYAYPTDMYAYPMYPVSILPGQMPAPYMMGQPTSYYPDMRNTPYYH